MPTKPSRKPGAARLARTTNPAPWLQFVVENPQPRLPLGAIVHALGSVVGEVIGYREFPKSGRVGYVVLSIVHGEPRLVFGSEIKRAEPKGGRPELRVVR